MGQPGVSPRYTQMAHKWPLAGHLAGTDFGCTRVARKTHEWFCFRPELGWFRIASKWAEKKVQKLV